eukprot:CAMPEP_0206620910 /NCGR_PEP_ID=MMETSP0325_2-20121206/61921_1 /ASSEMBLY_ACC=CAM_ASM_000347 /TAXON_ID=2866 /ORGANISM="Crypthecodinium cohnii, Strain Seligo" /LENGTH=140 /DNA_ID=CAMNT_0054143993 /DNA_START=20 /DNA_END=438 /DNA_ORIENTATION=+
MSRSSAQSASDPALLRQSRRRSSTGSSSWHFGRQHHQIEVHPEPPAAPEAVSTLCERSYRTKHSEHVPEALMSTLREVNERLHNLRFGGPPIDRDCDCSEGSRAFRPSVFVPKRHLLQIALINLPAASISTSSSSKKKPL